MKRIAVAITAGLVAATSMGAPPPDKTSRTVSYRIIGAHNECPEWSDSRAKRNAGDIFGAALDQQWILGFISGIAAASHAAEDPLSLADGYLVFDWMDKYCRENPKADVMDGARKLLDELLAIKREKERDEAKARRDKRRPPPG